MIVPKHNNIKINNKEKITSNSKVMGRQLNVEPSLPSYIYRVSAQSYFLYCKDIKKMLKNKII